MEIDGDLFDAVEFGDLEYTQALLNANNLNSQDLLGKTLLMYAAEFEHENIVKYLLEQNAKKDLKDKEGKTALDYADIPEIKKILKED